MHSIRTGIPVSCKKMFREFLDANELTDVFIGDYIDNSYNILGGINKLCFAYSDSSVKSIANMSYLVLKYNSLEEAFRQLTQNKRH